jgi:ribosomal protein L32
MNQIRRFGRRISGGGSNRELQHLQIGNDCSRVNGRDSHAWADDRGHQSVPADICDTCGEYYLSEEVTRKVMELGEAAVARGTEVEVLRFAA